jgi:hypothetical protein
MLKLKISTTKDGTIVGLCDSELIGKTIKDSKSKACLDLSKHAGFYDGEAIDERDIKARRRLEIALRYSKSINVVGKRAVECIKSFGYNIDTVKMIDNVPHLQIYKIAETE